MALHPERLAVARETVRSAPSMRAAVRNGPVASLVSIRAGKTGELDGRRDLRLAEVGAREHHRCDRERPAAAASLGGVNECAGAKGERVPLDRTSSRARVTRRRRRDRGVGAIVAPAARATMIAAMRTRDVRGAAAAALSCSAPVTPTAPSSSVEP